MKKPFVKFFLLFTVGGFILIGATSLVLAKTFYLSMFSQGEQCEKSTQAFKNCAKEITVKVLIGPIWGTGVVIKQKVVGRDNIYTVITNAHVVRQLNPPYKIETSNGERYEAKLLGKYDYPDLALLEFKSTKKYPIASLYPAFSLASLPKEEEVFATGYPIDKSKGFVVTKGKISVLLPQAMSDGYQIGFSADIEQGMSGGALLNREGKLVGIIGKSSYPGVGFPNAYKFDNNFTPTLFPQELMENSSWAIPIEVAVNKWYSELSSNLAWNLPPSSIPIVSSNISKPLPVSEWNSKIEQSRNLYSFTQKLNLREDYKFEDLDKDGNLEIKTFDGRFACQFTRKYIEFLPLQIWKYKNNKFLDVTKYTQYRQIHSNHARKMLNEYNQKRDYFNNNREELKALLFAYLASEYLANEEEKGWRTLESLYTFNDQTQYFQQLENLLQ